MLYGKPKTKASRRSLRLTRSTVEVLAEHLRVHGSPATNLVFAGPDDGPIRGSNFRHRVWAAAVEASVGRPMRFHDLRHTHAALLIAAGVHPKVIQMRLGHSSYSTTMDLYGHLMPGIDDRAVDALEQMIDDHAPGSRRVEGPGDLGQEA